MKKIVVVVLLLCIHYGVIAQQQVVKNPISIFRPYDIKFTIDNRYLFVNSDCDPKIWDLSNLNCINFGGVYWHTNYGFEKAWSYLPEQRTFYFHTLTDQTDQMIALEENTTDYTRFDAFGKDGKYTEQSFDKPATFFLADDIFLVIRLDKIGLPYISVEKTGDPKPLFIAKMDNKAFEHTENKFFHVIPGENGISYLASWRPLGDSKTGDVRIYEIDLSKKKSRLLAEGIKEYLGNDEMTPTVVETMKRSFGTPGYLVLDLNGIQYAVRKSDGKTIAGTSLASRFPDQSLATFYGERDGKLIVGYKNPDKNRAGFSFDTYDFDGQKRVDNILNYTIDLAGVMDYKIAVSYDGLQFVIAYKWDQDQGFKVAYMANGKLTMFDDPSHTAENLIAEVAEQARLKVVQLQKQVDEMSKRPTHEIITKKWVNKVIAANGDMQSSELLLNCSPNGQITGTLEAVSTYYVQGPYGQTMSVYAVKYEVSGTVTSKDRFTLKIGNVIRIDPGLQATPAGTEIPMTILIDTNETKTEVRGFFLQCSFGNYK